MDQHQIFGDEQDHSRDGHDSDERTAMAARPRKWSRANAYPASESKKTRPTVTLTVTTTELVNHRGKSAWDNLRKASAVQLRGIGVSQFVLASASLLKEVPICRMKGNR